MFEQFLRLQTNKTNFAAKTVQLQQVTTVLELTQLFSDPAKKGNPFGKTNV